MFEVRKAKAEIRAYGEVGWPGEGFTSEDFFAGLDEMDGDDVTILMQSPGGDVQQGLSIFNQLTDYPGKVTMRIDSMSGSIASVIQLGADVIEAYPQSMVMVHNPWTIVMGDAESFRRTANVLDMLADDIADIYAERTSESKKYWREVMDKTTEFDEQQAIAVGLVHNVYERKKKKPAMAAAKSTARPRLAALHAIRNRMRLNIDNHRQAR